MKTFKQILTESKKIIKEDKVYVFVAPYGNTMDVVKGEMQSTGGFKHTDSKFNYNRFPNEKPDATKRKLKSMGFKDSDIVIIQENGTYMKKAGTSFDRAFIGMDPQEAKNALVKYSHFDPKLIMIDEDCGKIEESDVPTSKRELYNKAKIGFNGLKKRLDDILSLVEKGEYSFVSSFLEDVATSCKRMAKAYDDAYRMDKAGKMYD